MKKIINILFFLFFIHSNVYSQNLNFNKMYENALGYIKNGKRTMEYAKKGNFIKDYCKIQDTKIRYSYKSEIRNLKVAKSNINLSIESVWCDFVKDRLNIDENCNKLSLGNNINVNIVMDSISKSSQYLNCNNEISIKENVYKRDVFGLYLYFSKICSNHLLAELRFKCVDSNVKGMSYTFYFIFKDNGKILKVYHGNKNHD